MPHCDHLSVRELFALALVLSLAGCGSSLESKKTWLDVDVVVTQWVYGAGGSGCSVHVYPRERDRPCTCTEDEWPKLGECASLSDMMGCSCTPPPASCLTGIHILDHGQVLEPRNPDFYGVYSFTTGSGDSNDLRLELEGCGGSASMALPSVTAPAPTITDLTNDLLSLDVSWTAEGEGTAASGRLIASVFGGDRCLEGFDGSTHLYGASGGDGEASLELTLLNGGQDAPMDLGVARLWTGSSVYDEIFVPQKDFQEGTWSLPEMENGTTTLTVDGETFDKSDGSPYVKFDNSTGAPLLGIVSLVQNDSMTKTFRVEYQAGAEKDSLRIQGSGPMSEVYSGEFPHVTPADALELGKPRPDSVDLSVGPVTLAKEGDPGTSVSVTLSAVFDMTVPTSRPTVP